MRGSRAILVALLPAAVHAITQPAGSTIYGTPTAEAHDIPRTSVPAFYRDSLNTPQPRNPFQTMNR